jgi:hypothetical protein
MAEVRRSWERARAVLGFALLAGALGCATHPISMQVQAGSTILIPLSGDDEGLQPGFGSEVTAAQGDHDDQRGELVFYLRGPLALPEGEQQNYRLRTRYVTRVFPDTATSGGYAGQIVALADVPTPSDTPAGPDVAQDEEFRLLVYRRERDLVSAGFPYGAETPYFGSFAGGTPDLRITVTPGIGAPNPDEGFFGSLAASATRSAQGLYSQVPAPQLLVRVGNAQAPGGENPGGAELELTYPHAKAQIEGIAEWGSAGRGSLVRWQLVENGRIRIWLVAPDTDIEQLAIAFRLRDSETLGRVSASEFAIAQSRLYRGDGTLYTPANLPALAGIR